MRRHDDHGSRRAAAAGERGTTLIELGFVGLLVLTMLLGVFEFGLLFRDNLTANDAAADAARSGAIMGPDVAPSGRNADFEIVRTLREGLSALDDTLIDTIVVFKADGNGSPENQVPLPCKSGVALAGICNVYDVRDAFDAVQSGDTAFFVCGGGNTNSCPYDPATRVDGPTRADIETVGVYVRIQRDGYTGLFADTWTIAKASTSRLEAGVVAP